MNEGCDMWAISDLHLYAGAGKRVRTSADELAIQAFRENVNLRVGWNKTVGERDWVLCPGDLSDSGASGGMHSDFRVIDELRGHKLLSPGNHDGGPWKQQLKIERFCRQFPTLVPRSFGAHRIPGLGGGPGVAVAAVRGAHTPDDAWFGQELVMMGPTNDRRRYETELGRTQLALAQAAALRRGGDRLILQIHYPPFTNFTEPNAFADLAEDAGVELCIFGHLHSGAENDRVFQGRRGETLYRLVAAPALGFVPLRIGSLGGGGLTWAEGLEPALVG